MLRTFQTPNNTLCFSVGPSINMNRVSRMGCIIILAYSVCCYVGHGSLDFARGQDIFNAQL
jgi:hypothetical protein